MVNVKDIAKSIEGAIIGKNKIAVFHYQVLINAKELISVNPVEFCKDVNVPVSYATEFSKMLKLANLMDDLGMVIKPRA